jgi:hypothetical protein
VGEIGHKARSQESGASSQEVFVDIILELKLINGISQKAWDSGASQFLILTSKL